MRCAHNTSAYAISVSLRSEILAIAVLAVQVALMLVEYFSLEQLVTASTLEAEFVKHFVSCSYFFGFVDTLLTFGTFGCRCLY